MFLSIIIPVYNVEKYIGSTLESIYVQSFDEKNFEVIIVNDGTLDGSMSIVSEYAKNHGNILIVNQENQGLSCARNVGLQQSNGEYIWFVDSDDTVSSESLMKLQQILSSKGKIDIFGFNMVCIDEYSGIESEEKIVSKKKHFELYGDQVDCFQLAGRICKVPVQRFVFKREFLISNTLFFYPGIYHEDEEFMPRALFMSKSICLIDYAPYRYLLRNTGSITSVKNVKRTQDKIKILETLTDFKNKYAGNRAEKSFFDFYVLMMVFSVLSDKTGSDIEADKLIRSKMNDLRLLLAYGMFASAHLWLWRQTLKSIAIFLLPCLGPSILKFTDKLRIKIKSKNICVRKRI